MLGVAAYSISYLNQCIQAVDAQMAHYEALDAAVGGTAAEKAVMAFEPEYLNSMVLALDHMFMHRLRGKEGKDGNPLNEVRMLANSIMEQGAVLTADKTIKYVAAKSITGIAVGDKIVLTQEVFQRLAQAYFEEISAKFL